MMILTSIFSNFSFTYENIIKIIQTIADIAVVWFLIYALIKVARGNQRTIQLFQGVIIVLVLEALASLLGLTTVTWILNNIVSWGALALIVIFQPEIRSILEKMGKSDSFARISSLSVNEKEHLIDELMETTANLAASKTGALITLEQGTSLTDYISTGVALNSSVSAELLCSIFMTTTPLHDGAVIIQGDKIACASAYFPPTSIDLPSRYGARHRAAIGISEITDAITIVVSEETGRVGVTTDGKIIQMNEKKLRAFLERVVLNKDTVTENKQKYTSESVSVSTLVDATKNEINDPELEFKDGTESNHRPMKTFQPASFTDDTDKIKKIKNSQSINLSGANSAYKSVAKDIVEAEQVSKNTSDVDEEFVEPKINIRNASASSNNENTGTIKTTKVVVGDNENVTGQGGNDNG